MAIELSPRRVTAAAAEGVRRFWPLIGGGALAVALVAQFASPTAYEASVEVLVPGSAPVDRQAQPGPAEVLSRNYGPLVRSDGVTREAAKKLGEPWTPEGLRSAITVTTTRDLFYLTITVAAGSPPAAADAANTVADAFVSRVREVQAQIQQPIVDNARQEIAAYSEQLRLIDERLASARPVVTLPDQAAALLEATIRDQTLTALLEARQAVLQHIHARNAEIRFAESRQRESAVIWQAASPPAAARSNLLYVIALPLLVLILGVAIATGVVLWGAASARSAARRAAESRPSVSAS